MVEKAKKRLLPVLLSVMIAALLAVTGFAILGTDIGLNAKSITADASDDGYNGMDEDVTDDDYDDGFSSDDGGYSEDVYTSNEVLYNYTTAGSYTITLKAGKYLFECWGAQGGTYGVGIGGLGGYARGELTISSQTTFYLYVGGQPTDLAGGYNGGGSIATHSSSGYSSAGGGGSDVRVGGTSLYNRMLAAGGGGGGGYNGSLLGTGGAGGTSAGANGGTGGRAYNNTNGTPGNGGTQTAGGENTATGSWGRAGAFGVGGDNLATSGGWNGCAGGGGWYGGSSAGALGSGGGGGSSYAATSTSTKPSGYLVTSTYYLSNTSGTGSQTGNGRVQVTALNVPPAQSSVPTLSLNRYSSSTFNVTTNLNVTDSDGDTVKIRTTGIYMGAGTTYALANAISGSNYWLSYTCNADGTSFTVRALRYWSGTKRFYINLKDYSTVNVCTGNVWVSFDATCTAGSYSYGTGPTNLGAANTAFRYGASTNATNPTTATSTIYNPLGTGRRTLWLADALSAGKDTLINVDNLFTHTQGTNANYTDNEVVVFSSSITYGANRYAKDSTNATAEAIAGNPATSAYYTQVTPGSAQTVTQYTGSATQSATGGYKTLALRAKANVPAGPYYYTMTVTVQLIDKLSMAVQKSETFDIVYRVDNTRPVISATTPQVTLAQGGTYSMSLSSICTDPDKNTLTIADVVVPDHEYVGLDQYGNLITTNLGNYNFGTQPTYSATHATVTTTAQNPNAATGFLGNYIYKTTGSGANNSFSSSQPQGSSDTAYVGYYINTAADTITFVGNKASRTMYASGRTNALLDFYILVKVRDSGNVDDNGIWFPVALKVNSAAPVAAGYPSVSGNTGDVFYYTPLGVQESNGSYYGIGTYKGSEDNTKFLTNVLEKNGGDNTVLPFAYDKDNYSYYVNDSYQGSVPVQSKEATWAQREAVFIMPTQDKLQNKLANYYLFNENKYSTSGTAAVGIQDGFKEFFSVETVDLYAEPSILLGLTADEINQFIADGMISIENGLVKYKGLKITLKKHTMGKYVSFYVHVRDSHGSESNIRIAVSVNNNEISTSNARSNIDENKKNFHVLYDEDNNVVAERVSTGSGLTIAFSYKLKVGDTIAITPYDLFYDIDTFGVNGGYVTNIPVSEYNTGIYDSGHADMMKGINKDIAVYAADSPETEFPNGTYSTLNLKKLSIANTEPQIFGGDIYIARQYVGEDTNAGKETSEYFLITARRKTPASGYVSFNYQVSTTAGGTVTAEIRIYVENSLPKVREELSDLVNGNDSSTYKMPFKLTASTDIETVNSSMRDEGLGEVLGMDENGTEYFIVNSETYNVREFTLNDLFYDPDGDLVQFGRVSEGIAVGTHDEDGNFVDLGSNNVYVNAYIGAGSNVRAGYSSCLILQGLSSTQGIKGGLWIRFSIGDNAIGSTATKYYEFQVEVFNSAPKYADMTGSNAMENTAGEGEAPQYSWIDESDDTTLHVANLLNPNNMSSSYVALTNPKNPGETVNTQIADNEIIEKAVYIVSDESVMEYYRATIQAAVDKSNAVSGTFTYSPSQVRVIAQDADRGQGLALWGAGYNGVATYATPVPGAYIRSSLSNDTSTLAFTSDEVSRNAAVLFTPMYSTEQNMSYYDANNVVQIMTFDEDGTFLDPTTETDNDKKAEIIKKANDSTRWVIALNFTQTPSAFDLRIRLRDSNNEFVLYNGPTSGNQVNDAPDTRVITATEGGFSNLNNSSTNNLYSGPRAEDGQPTAYNSALFNGNGFFGVKISKRPKGLYNNFTKWASNETFNGGTDGGIYNGTSLNNVWTLDGFTPFTVYNTDFTTSNPKGFFVYDGIDVPVTESGVGVPISYFAWPQNNNNSNNRNGQSIFAWYDIDTFGTKVTSGATLNEFTAITLSDGYNSWSGADLNRNPYVIFTARRGANDGKAINESGHPFGIQNGIRSYLHDQQRFSVITDTSGKKSATKIPVIDTQYTDAYFFEDVYGLIIQKNTIRSVGNLTLTVKLTLWQTESDGSVVKVPDMAITVSVPLRVANSTLNLENSSRVYTPAATSAGSGLNIALSTNQRLDSSTLGNAFAIYSSELDDQYTGRTSSMTGDLKNDAGIDYRENLYFLASSITGGYSSALPLYNGETVMPEPTSTTMTQTELDHIKAAAVSTDMQVKLADYFGIATADIANIAIINGKLAVAKSEGGNLVVDSSKAQPNVNPYFMNYFSVSPANSDSQRISISPIKMTTFDYEGLKTQTEIREAAARRNLSVEFTYEGNESNITIKRIYYNLKLIVYDRLSVGYSANSTTFADSSFDVITIEVEIVNSAPALSSLYSSTYPGTTSKNAREISLVKGRSVDYNFTDIFIDADMVYDSTTGTYKTRDQIIGTDNKESFDRDTGDYLKQLTDKDGKPLTFKVTSGNVSTELPLLVGIEFMTLQGLNNVTNQYTDSNPSGAIQCVPTEGGIHIEVKNRAANTEVNTDIAAWIKLTFTDNYGSSLTCYVGVRITNAAPTLSANATSVRNITMTTGQYFTLYTTPYSEFVQGENISKTVGNRNDEQFTSGTGTYYTTLAASTDSSVSTRLTNPYQPWSYSTGPVGYTPSSSSGDKLPNIQIGAEEYNPGNTAYSGNLGYMAIASDDAPWTLRIGSYTMSASGTSNVTDLISARYINIVPYEGSSRTAATAIMFTALGAVQNATISVTVYDGVNLAGTSTLSVTYTFNITVVSTAPTAITSTTDSTYSLGRSLATTAPEMLSRISHETGMQTPEEATYNLRLNVGESVTLRTSDFAHDIDRGDDSILPLLPLSGTNPFKIQDTDYPDGEVITSSRYVELTHSKGASLVTEASIQFTVTATNFHNGSNDNHLYSEVSFYIGDPYFADVTHAVLVHLRVYVYPSGVSSVAATRNIDVTGVTASTGPQTVKLVTTTAEEGGLFVDQDASATNTLYSVKVYTLTHYKLTNDEGTEVDKSVIESFAMSDFVPDNKWLVAQLTVSEISSGLFTTSASAFDSSFIHSEIVRKYIGGIEFSQDGKEMYLTPSCATNGLKQIVGDNNRTGFRLCVSVEKFIVRNGGQGVGSTPDNGKTPSYSASVFTSMSVLNSAPIAIGDTDKNVGRHIATNSDTVDTYRAYLSVEGKRGDAWVYPIYNNISDHDEALFTDPDGDTLGFVDYTISRIYTYAYTDTEQGTVARQVDVEDASVKAAAASAFSLKPENYTFQIKNGDTVVKESVLPSIRLSILNKIVVPSAPDRTVYLEINVTAKDAYSSERATTTLTLGIANSSPVFKSEEEIASKYNSSAYGTSYTKAEFAEDAELTLTLNRDNVTSGAITKNGIVTIPIDDLVTDDDYTGATGIERFTFVAAGLSNTADMSLISGKSASTLWLDSDKSDGYGVTGDSSQYESKNFHVSVYNDNNTAIVFRVNTYNRGATARLVLKVSDTAGETTGVLTINLIVGNSAPIDKVSTGEANGRIILAGGENGDLNNGTAFTATAFNILDFVRDNNPNDNRSMSEEPDEATTYLRISSYEPGEIIWEDPPTQNPGDSSGDDSDGAGAGIIEQQLVNFITAFGQSFTIAPIPGMYGRQDFRITITDGGNSDSADSLTVTVELRIQITKDPTDLPTIDFEVYWMRTKDVTSNEIFGDKGEGILVQSVALEDSSKSSIVGIEHNTDTNVWTVSGKTKTGDDYVMAKAQVVVGTEITESAKTYPVSFRIKVLPNEKPNFTYSSVSDNSVIYGPSTIVYIQKGYLTEDNTWEPLINEFLVDNEGDDIKLVSASSNKSSLIDVVADTTNNKLIFHFKSRGDTTITCQVRDAVGVYTYTFKIGNADLPEPNFFIGIIAQVQENPFIFIIIGAAILLFLIILIIIIAAVRKKKKMRAEIEALLVSEMELEEQMLKLAAGPSPTSYQAYGYLPPTPNVQQQPGLMLGSGQGGPDPNAAIGLNPGQQGGAQPQNGQVPPANGGFSDDDL